MIISKKRKEIETKQKQNLSNSTYEKILYFPTQSSTKLHQRRTPNLSETRRHNNVMTRVLKDKANRKGNEKRSMRVKKLLQKYYI